MALQEVTVTVSDGNLGLVPEATDRIVLFIGPSSVGTVNVIQSIGSVDGMSGIGHGDMPEAVRLALESSGGPVLAMPLAVTVGTNGAVTQSGAGPAITVGGNPFADYSVKLEITFAGVLGTSKFKLSLDNGETYTSDIFTAASYPIPNTGLTLTLTAGPYILGEVYSFASVGPSYNTTQLNNALDAAFLDTREFGLVSVVSPAQGVSDAAKASACAGIVAALQTKLEGATLTRHKYTRGFVEAPNVADAALITAFASVSASRVSVGAGFAKILSPYTGRKEIVPAMRAAVAKIARKPIGKDAAEVGAGFTGYGLLPSSVLSLSRNEFQTPGLDAARFVTFRTYLGVTGFFVEKFRLMSPAGSDFKYIQHGQVIDRACKDARLKLLTYLSRDLSVKGDGTGQLTEGQAKAIDADIDQAVRLALVSPGHVQNVQVKANRTDDVLSTELLRVKLAVLPKGYLKFIELTVGFTKTIVTEA